jgi:hypothetical protein
MATDCPAWVARLAALEPAIPASRWTRVMDTGAMPPEDSTPVSSAAYHDRERTLPDFPETSTAPPLPQRKPRSAIADTEMPLLWRASRLIATAQEDGQWLAGSTLVHLLREHEQSSSA